MASSNALSLKACFTVTVQNAPFRVATDQKYYDGRIVSNVGNKELILVSINE